MIEQALRGYLSAQADVTALCGLRIFPGMIPQHVYEEATRQPCLVFNLISSERDVMDSCGTVAQVTRHVQIDAYALSRIEAIALADAVRTSLVDFSGDMNGTQVDFVRIENEWDLLDPEPGLSRRCLRFRIRHNE